MGGLRLERARVGDGNLYITLEKFIVSFLYNRASLVIKFSSTGKFIFQYWKINFSVLENKFACTDK
jgi:hypothetical protein